MDGVSVMIIAVAATIKAGSSWRPVSVAQVFLVAFGAVVIFAMVVASYRRHSLLFQHISKGEDLSEALFWHIAKRIFYVSKDRISFCIVVVWALCALLAWRPSISKLLQIARHQVLF